MQLSIENTIIYKLSETMNEPLLFHKYYLFHFEKPFIIVNDNIFNIIKLQFL
jgi:hypothetical protein